MNIYNNFKQLLCCNFKQIMDNRNLDDEEFEQMRENERALRKITDEATQNISRILRSCHTRNNEFANRQEREEEDDGIQFIGQVQRPTTQRNQEINEAEASNNNKLVSHIEASNNGISQIATGETVTAQAQLSPYQTFDQASSSSVQRQSIQLNDQNPSYSTSAANQVKSPAALYLDDQQNDENNLDDLIEQKSILPAQKLYRENTVLKRKITDMQQPVANANHHLLQTARRSTPFSCVVQTNLGWRRKFQKIPIDERMPSLSKINPDWLKVKHEYQHVGVPEHFIKPELLEKLGEKTNVTMGQQQPYQMQVKQEARSEFDAELPIEEQQETMEDASSSEGIKEAAFVYRPPPVCIIPRMPKVRLVFQDIRKKSKKDSIKKLKIETSPDKRTVSRDSSSSSSSNTSQPSSNILHHHMPLSRRNVSTSGTMNACKDVMSNKLANQLIFHGSIRCDECEGKRELCQSGYPLHMLVKHGIFIDINGPILDHLRTLGEQSFRAIVWRCVHCKKDFGKIHEFDQHCKSEPHLSMMKAPSRQKKYTLNHVLSMCNEKNFIMEN